MKAWVNFFNFTDCLTTYIGITYCGLAEKTPLWIFLFDRFGLILPLLFKIAVVVWALKKIEVIPEIYRVSIMLGCVIGLSLVSFNNLLLIIG